MPQLWFRASGNRRVLLWAAVFYSLSLVTSASAQRTFPFAEATPVVDDGCVDDANGAGNFGVTRDIIVNANGVISDVNIGFQMTHSFRGDIQVAIAYKLHGFGTLGPFVLANNHGGSADNYHVTFDSDAASPCSTVCAAAGACNTLPGPSCRPNVSLDVFDQQQTPGIFTLTVCDRAPQDTGTLDAFSIVITGQSRSLDVDGNGVISSFTDGILTLRHQLGFDGGILIDSAVADDCTRCTAPAIKGFLSYP